MESLRINPTAQGASPLTRNVVTVIFGLMLLLFGWTQVAGQTPITNREALNRLQMRFITDAYKQTATAKLLEEVNAVAMEMRLDENLPIGEEDLREVKISPPFLSDHSKIRIRQP